MTTETLTGRRVAILATDGVEQVELVQPREAVENAGATVTLVALDHGDIQAMESDVNAADTFTVDRVVAEVSADDFDALILPGGTFVQARKPVGVICHGAWTLVEADVLKGRTLTSYPSIRTDIRNAGGTVVDEEVVVDGNLVSSRNPDDLPAFCAKIVEHFSA
jgi:protease I